MNDVQIDKISETLSNYKGWYKNYIECDLYQENANRMKKTAEYSAVRLILLDELHELILDHRKDIPADCDAHLIKLAESLNHGGNRSGNAKGRFSAYKNAITDCQDSIKSTQPSYFASTINSWLNNTTNTKNNVKQQVIDKLESFRNIFDSKNLIADAYSIAAPEKLKTMKSARS